MMGLDLRIYPNYTTSLDQIFSLEMILLERDDKLFEKINQTFRERGVTPRMSLRAFGASCEDPDECGYGEIEECRYGHPITGIYVSDLRDKLMLFTPEHWRNKAFKASLQYYPGDLILWLYWC